MKALIIALGLVSVASAATPECEYWSKRVGTLDMEIAVQKDKLKSCEINCRDTEILIGALVRQKEVTQVWLDDPFYGCAPKKK